jgi:hypothetical protein
MLQKINQEMVLNALEWGYSKALNGVGAIDSAYELAEDYQKRNGSKHEAVASLVNWQTAKCATSGFVSGLGGLLTLPVTVPVNITSVLFVQLRMIAAIALLGGHDPKSDKVKTLAYTCLAGSAAADILKGIGIRMGEKLTERAIQNLSAQVLTKVNQAVGFRLVTKFGQKGLVNLGKAVPLAGGLVGGAFDATSTKVIGRTATKVFIGPN